MVNFPQPNPRGIHLTRYDKSKGYHVQAAQRLQNLQLDSKHHDLFLSQSAWEDISVVRYHLILEISEILNKLMHQHDLR